ncbi:MAG: hypothetical protein AB7K24_01455 [Gemmataceae bacterium]
MPTPISLALVAMFLYLVLNLIIGGAAVLQGSMSMYMVGAESILALLIIFGTMKGNRLAWQGGRLGGLVGFIYYGYKTALLYVRPENNLGLGDRMVELMALGIQAVCLLVVYGAFATHPAKSHFELICPQCSESSGTTNGDLFFTTVRCKNCNYTF